MSEQKYESGIETRGLILKCARELFLEKGFHATSYDDICSTAHINRGTIYYHFKSKDKLRSEILQGIFDENRKIAENYTLSVSSQCVFTTYLVWQKILTDPAQGSFLIDFYSDYPVYQPKGDLADLIMTTCKNAFGHIKEFSEADDFAFTSLYAYLGGISQMVKYAPNRFPLDTLFWNAIECCCKILSLPKEATSQIFSDVARCTEEYAKDNQKQD